MNQIPCGRNFRKILLATSLGLMLNQLSGLTHANTIDETVDKKVVANSKNQNLSSGSKTSVSPWPVTVFEIPDWAAPVAPWPKVSQNVTESIDQILASPAVKTAMNYLKNDESKTLKEAVFLSEIPAPPFTEEKKAKAFLGMIQRAGIPDAKIDKEGNVVAIRKGNGKGPTVVIDAHVDTIFPVQTDIKVKVKDGIYYGPGLTDNSFGMATMLSIARALNDGKVQTVGDIVFLASVGEEGLGNLRGVKAYFAENKNIDAALILESFPPGVGGIINTASNRYEVTYQGPGGHSYAAFGSVPSAIHAMGDAIAKINQIQLPKFPRTVYNVGIVKGGTSVNTISPDAVMQIDIRSDGTKELEQTTQKVLDIINQSVVDENKRWGTNSLRVIIKLIGSRAGGTTPPDSIVVQSFLGATRANQSKELMLIGASTNAGVPISMGIPTIVIPPGGKFTGFHSLGEAMDPKDSYKGAQIALTTLLSLVGVKDVASPLVGKNINK